MQNEAHVFLTIDGLKCSTLLRNHVLRIYFLPYLGKHAKLGRYIMEEGARELAHKLSLLYVHRCQFQIGKNQDIS